jgi:hypothetical protein
LYNERKIEEKKSKEKKGKKKVMSCGGATYDDYQPVESHGAWHTPFRDTVNGFVDDVHRAHRQESIYGGDLSGYNRPPPRAEGGRRSYPLPGRIFKDLYGKITGVGGYYEGAVVEASDGKEYVLTTDPNAVDMSFSMGGGSYSMESSTVVAPDGNAYTLVTPETARSAGVEPTVVEDFSFADTTRSSGIPELAYAAPPGWGMPPDRIPTAPPPPMIGASISHDGGIHMEVHTPHSSSGELMPIGPKFFRMRGRGRRMTSNKGLREQLRRKKTERRSEQKAFKRDRNEERRKQREEREAKKLQREIQKEERAIEQLRRERETLGGAMSEGSFPPPTVSSSGMNTHDYHKWVQSKMSAHLNDGAPFPEELRSVPGNVTFTSNGELSHDNRKDDVNIGAFIQTRLCGFNDDTRDVIKDNAFDFFKEKFGIPVEQAKRKSDRLYEADGKFKIESYGLNSAIKSAVDSVSGFAGVLNTGAKVHESAWKVTITNPSGASINGGKGKSVVVPANSHFLYGHWHMDDDHEGRGEDPVVIHFQSVDPIVLPEEGNVVASSFDVHYYDPMDDHFHVYSGKANRTMRLATDETNPRKSNFTMKTDVNFS